MAQIYQIIRLLRPKQWIKNVFVFLPMFFAGQLGNSDCWKFSLLAFVAFSLMAGAVYCLNDVRDAEADRLHPVKQLRPVASGAVKVHSAIALMLLCMAGSIAVSVFCFSSEGIWPVAIVTAYLLMNLAYCFALKRYAIVDVFIIATGFVLRLVMGGVVCSIWLSPWIVCLTFLLTLFMAFAKRRDDVVLYKEKGIMTRANTPSYNLPFMNQTLGILASVTIVCYIIYSVQPEVEARLGSRYVYLTSIFVLAGILRYLQVALVDAKSGSPTEILLKDRFIQCCLAGWIISFMIIIYL